MSGQIFISYRREDASSAAGRLYDRLSAQFPQNEIFMDVDNLSPGIDFVEAIETSVSSCEVLIAVIGRGWLVSSDEEGKRRLENPDDFVRLEITTAIKRNIRVIPVLVDHALMPRRTDLPDDLKPLARRNALKVSNERFRFDSGRLIEAINEVLEKAKVEQRQREQDRLEAEQRQKQQLEAEQREKEGRDADQRKSELETLNERREKEQLDAEHQKQLEATRSSSEPELEARIRQSAVISDHNLRLLQKWSFTPFLLVLIAYFLPFRYYGNAYQSIWQWGFDTENIFFTLAFLSWPIIMLCLRFFSFRSKALVEAIISWVGVVAFIVLLESHQVYGSIMLTMFLWLFFQLLGASIMTILALRKAG